MHLKFICMIFILLSFAIVNSACPVKHSEIEVPAVVSETNGGLVTLEFDMEPGIGKMYASITPPLGISTQSSIESGGEAAANLVGFNIDECDYRITIKGISGSKYVDGPSAGLAIGLAFASLFSGKQLNDDVIATGTLNQYGEVGSIGGLIEKVTAAVLHDKKVLLTRLSNVKDYIIAYSLMDDYDIKIINVDNLEDAFEIATSDLNEELLSKYMAVESFVKDTREVNRSYGYSIQRFDAIADKVVDAFESEAVSYYMQLDNNSYKKKMVGSMLDDIDYQRRLIDNGFSYTGANNIFNHFLDLRFIKAIDEGPINLSMKIAEVEECLNSIESYEKRTDNWEWITGSEVRINWAENNIRNIDTSLYDNDVEEAKFEPLYEILSAEGWCEISGLISFNGDGKLVDESELNDLVSMKAEEVKKFILKFPEASNGAIEHLSKADEAVKKKEYLAALYDYSFAYGIQMSYSETFDKSSVQVKNMLDGIEEMNYTHLWPRIYHSQVVYLYEVGDYKSAYRIKCIADKMEEYFNEAENVLMKSIIEETATVKGFGGSVSAQDVNMTKGLELCQKQVNDMKGYLLVFFAIILVEVIFIISLMFNTKI